MKKIYLFLFYLIVAFNVTAQIATINGSINTTQLNGTGSSNYHVSEYLYLESEIGASNFTTAGTSIKRINFNINAIGNPTTQNNIKIYLQNVPSTTTALTTGNYNGTTGYTEVYSGSFTATAQGWAGVNLTTPFVRTVGNNLQMMIERTDNLAPTTPTTFWCLNGTNLSRRINSTTAPVIGTTAYGLSAFRISAQFVNGTDLSVVSIETLGKIPTVAAFPHQIKALIQNNGNTTIAAGTQVTLLVTGTITFNNVKTTNLLIPGAQQIITFDAINSMNVGTNTINVTVPADDNLNNNTSVFTQTVTNTTFGYPDASARNTNVGFNTGQGLLVSKHTTPKAIRITGIRAFLTTSANTVFGVVCNSQGVILGQTADYNVVPSDSLAYKTINFTTPINIGADSTFFIGIGQRAGSYGYFPLGSQFENPARLNTHGSVALTGGTPTFVVTLGRFMLEAEIEQVLPVSLVSFTGIKEGRNNILKWETANELSNKGFELMRSADGKNFSTITTIGSLAIDGNSTTKLNYSFIDDKAPNGTNYYQLKQIDKDGKTTLSNVVAIKGNSVKGVEIANVYPNPATVKLNVIIGSEKEEKVTVSVTDLAGRIISNKVVALIAGTNNVEVNTANLTSGTYLVKITKSTNEVVFQKFVKQ